MPQIVSVVDVAACCSWRSLLLLLWSLDSTLLAPHFSHSVIWMVLRWLQWRASKGNVAVGLVGRLLKSCGNCRKWLLSSSGLLFIWSILLPVGLCLYGEHSESKMSLQGRLQAQFQRQSEYESSHCLANAVKVMPSGVMLAPRSSMRLVPRVVFSGQEGVGWCGLQFPHQPLSTGSQGTGLTGVYVSWIHAVCCP